MCRRRGVPLPSDPSHHVIGDTLCDPLSRRRLLVLLLGQDGDPGAEGSGRRGLFPRASRPGSGSSTPASRIHAAPLTPPPSASMQPRKPQQPAVLLSLWLMLSLALPAAAVAPRDREHTDVPTRPPAAGLPRGILQRAAHVALHFFNFQAGSPSALRVLAAVQEGRARVSGRDAEGHARGPRCRSCCSRATESSNAAFAVPTFPRPGILYML